MSEYYLIKGETLTSAADAIRAKTGEADLIPASGFAEKIQAISGGAPNGTNWTEGQNIGSTCNGIAGHSGLWVAACSNGIYYSEDGKSWTNSNATTDFCYDVLYGDGMWLVRCRDSLYYSANGKEWTQTTGNEWTSISSVGYIGGRWVCSAAVDYTTEVISTSFDCVTWTNVDSNEQTFRSFGKFKGVFLALGSEELYYSADGQSWAATGTQSAFTGLAIGNGIVVVSGYYQGSKGYESGLFYSTDGVSWTHCDIDVRAQTVAYGNGIFVAGTYGNGIYYSTDGMNWNQTAITSGYISRIGFKNGIWMCDGISANGTFDTPIAYSLDGINWEEGNINVYTPPITYCDGLWVTQKTDNTMCYSPAWEPST